MNKKKEKNENKDQNIKNKYFNVYSLFLKGLKGKMNISTYRPKVALHVHLFHVWGKKVYGNMQCSEFDEVLGCAL